MRTTTINQFKLPTFADNTTAIAWWLQVGNWYKTALWVVMIVI